jgi:hypothetical protein
VAFAGLDPKVRRSANKEVIGGPNKRGVNNGIKFPKFSGLNFPTHL